MNRITPSLMFLLVGCSEYSFSDKANPSEPPDTAPVADTSGPPVCPTSPPSVTAPANTIPCEFLPQPGSFTPVVKWHWQDNPVHESYSQVMAAPAVLNLTDDNGDGIINEHDVPDIVFTAFSGGGYTSPGALVAISGDDGHTLFSVTDVAGYQPYGAGGVALGDIDADGVPEIFVASTSGLLALTNTGALKWHAPITTTAYGLPSLADLNGDGQAEVIYGRTVLNTNGSVRWVGTGGTGGSIFSSFVMDVNADGIAEVVAGNTVYQNDGSILWQSGADGACAAGDLDGDGFPEIVTVVSGTVTARDAQTGSQRWQYILPDGGGGPPTIADFDGDGQAEIGLASRQVYRVLEGDGSVRWEQPVQDYSSSVTGSAVFDFEGDGAAEVVYADEQTLWVYDGKTGAVELQYDGHSSGTLFEYPLIVDVDNDGSSEIVVASNDYSSYNDSRGITVIGDLNDSWSPARPVWNQHAYHIDNIRDDGTIPPRPRLTYRSYNSFRAGNSQTVSGSLAPDLVAGPLDLCLDECSTGEIVLWAPVASVGAAADGRPISVALVRLDATSESLLRIEQLPALGLAEATVVGPIRLTRADFGARGLAVRVDADAALNSRVLECKETNNERVLSNFPCDE